MIKAEQSLDISPPDGELLVPQSHVAAHQIVAEGEEAEDVEPVVDGDQDHLLLDEIPHPVEVLGPNMETPAMNEEHDGSVEAGDVGGEDVESQTVLRHVLRSNAGIGRLNTGKPVLIGLQYSCPGSERLMMREILSRLVLT